MLFRVLNPALKQVSGLWDKAKQPAENLLIHRKNPQLPHKKDRQCCLPHLHALPWKQNTLIQLILEISFLNCNFDIYFQITACISTNNCPVKQVSWERLTKNPLKHKLFPLSLENNANFITWDVIFSYIKAKYTTSHVWMILPLAVFWYMNRFCFQEEHLTLLPSHSFTFLGFKQREELPAELEHLFTS